MKVKLTYITKNAPVMIINNQEIKREIKSVALVCRKCNNVLIDFGTQYLYSLQNTAQLEEKNKNKFESTYHYCPKCGEPLEFDIIDTIIDIDKDSVKEL